MKGNKKKGKNEMVIDRYTGLLFLKKRERERERERDATEIYETLSKK